MNWVLAVQCFYFYRLLKKQEPTSTFHSYWTWFFLCYAGSLFFGGFSHLLYHYIGMAGKIPNWSLALIGVTFAELAMVADIADPKKKATLVAVIRGKLVAAVVILIYDFTFKWVMVHSGGMILIIGAISFARWRGGQSSYRYFIYGIGFLLLMAFVKIAELDFHPEWFTRDDFAHFLMLLMYWLFYKGVKGVTGSR